MSGLRNSGRSLNTAHNNVACELHTVDERHSTETARRRIELIVISIGALFQTISTSVIAPIGACNV